MAVVTAATPEGPVGFTCQTFGALSLEPTLISFSAVTASNSWPKARDVGVVGVNILSSEQEADRASLRAGRATTSSPASAGRPAPTARRLIEDALAHLEGHIEFVTTQGDHDIVVVAAEYVLSHHGAPLVFYRGGFGGFD